MTPTGEGDGEDVIKSCIESPGHSAQQSKVSMNVGFCGGMVVTVMIVMTNITSFNPTNNSRDDFFQVRSPPEMTESGRTGILAHICATVLAPDFLS